MDIETPVPASRLPDAAGVLWIGKCARKRVTVQQRSGGPVGLDLSCPTCGRIDFVQRVSAVYSGGTGVEIASAVMGGVGITSSGVVPVLGVSTTEHRRTSVLAQSLAPEPDVAPVGRLIGFGLVASIPFLAGMFPAFVVITNEADSAPFAMRVLAAVTFLVILAIVPAILFGIAARRVVMMNRIVRGRPAAYAAWGAAVYCHRCHSCHWPAHAPPGVPTRTALHPLSFQSIVWHFYSV